MEVGEWPLSTFQPHRVEPEFQPKVAPPEFVLALANRVADQSELLSRRAERPVVTEIDYPLE